MKNAKYGSSLTDNQWEYLQPMLPKGVPLDCIIVKGADHCFDGTRQPHIKVK